MKIIVDGMGGDNAPEAVVKGCVMARDEFGCNLIISGKEDIIKALLEKETDNFNNIEILNAEDVITNEDKPVMAIKRKKESSLVKALYAVRDKEADAIISAGNTGALLTGGTVIIGRISGIERPALAPFFPTAKGFSLLLDSGANADCKANWMVDFAIMGSIYYGCIFNDNNPKVGLLNIGAEKGKGSMLTNETYELLEASGLNFYGNIEARDVFNGDVKVVVADGFTGNVLLKSVEGTAGYMLGGLKEAMFSSFRSKLGALLLKPALKEFKKKLDYGEVGGAILLGTNAPVVKAHGSSDAIAIKNAIKQAKKIVDEDVVGKIRQKNEERIVK